MTTQTLSRRGRPPAVTQLNSSEFAITVKGMRMRFLRTVKGNFRLLRPNAEFAGSERIEYARSVLSREA